MKTESGEHLKTRTQYAEEAVQLALAGRWEEAVEVNRQIMEKFGPDQETHNRLGKALTELGNLEEARAEYEATLKINPLNPIATKNAAKLAQLLEANQGLGAGPARLDVNLFVEEMGKTANTTLDDVADVEISSKVSAGDLVELRVEGGNIVAETVRGVRLGLIEPKLARRLIKFIQGGNRYQAAVTSCEGTVIRLIIRETYQDVRFAGKPSFPMKRKREVDFRPYVKDSWIERDLEGFSGEDEEPTDHERLVDDMEGMQVDDEREDDLDLGEEIEIDEEEMDE